MVDDVTLGDAISKFAAETTRKLSALSARGEPEDQIRAPLETLVGDLADICRVGRRNVVPIGESSIADLKTRPDYAVQRHGALVGYIEVKAPGKGADPRRYKDKHDRDQWLKLKALPNLVYTDGNGFSLWRDGELVGKVVKLDGDIATDGAAVTRAPGLDALFDDFLSWEPIPPRTPKQLAEMTARVCRLMRDEVGEQLTLGNPALTDLARDWRALLFPEADEQTFADGYAQAVTFGLLVARSRGISVAGGISAAAKEVGTTHSLIGSALFVLTLNTESHSALKTSVGTLTRVLEVVDWPKISKGRPEAWLYFYEEFLSVYDTALRKKTGSYYTPPEVVTAMTGFVEKALRTRFERPQGL
ncbi:MAG: type ISP restriction/modification enzyme, partial [Acidimicrobiales bacterium]